MIVLLKMLVKSLPENGTFLWTALVLVLSPHGQRARPARLRSPSLRGGDSPFPPHRAAKLPTQELTKLWLPKNEYRFDFITLASVTANDATFNGKLHCQFVDGLWFPSKHQPELARPCHLLPLNSLPLSRSAPLYFCPSHCRAGPVRLSQYSDSVGSNLMYTHLVTTVFVAKMVLESCHIQYTLRKLNYMAWKINGWWQRVERK